MSTPTITPNGLHCGYDHSTNLSIGKYKGFIQILCNSHEKSGNVVCNIEELSIITKDKFDNLNVSREKRKEVMDRICNQLSTDVYKLKYHNDKFYLED